MSVHMMEAKIKRESVTDVQAAAEKMFAAINAAQPEGIRYASSLLPDGETFVALLQVDDRVDNPLPGFPEFREFLEGVEASRAKLANVQPLTERRVSAMSLGATRTTRSPRRSRKRSNAPETWRQSSIAHTRSAPTPRPRANRSSNDRRLALTVRSASTRPVGPSTAPALCECLWVSAPITIIRTVPSLGSLTNRSPADTSQSGRCHAPYLCRESTSSAGPRAVGGTARETVARGRG